MVLDDDFHTVPRDRYLGNPADGPTTIQARSHQLTYQQQLTDNWSLTVSGEWRSSALHGYSSDAELAAARQSLYDDGATLTRQHRYRNYHADNKALRIELSGRSQWLGMTHHWLWGIDGYRYSQHTALSRFRGAAGSYAINIHHPRATGPGPQVSPVSENIEHQHAWAGYMQDQIDITAHWKLLLGGRYDHIRQALNSPLNQQRSTKVHTPFSPRLGLVWDINDQVSWYASYSEGFKPLSGSDWQGNGFSPEQSRSSETGLKFTSALASGTLAIFDATKTNILTADPIHAGFSAPLGEARSQGIELDMTGQLGNSNDWRLSYAYLDTRTVHEVIDADWGVNLPKGSRLANVPHNTLDLQIKHWWTWHQWHGHLGVAMHYVGDRQGDSADASYQLADYTRYQLFSRVQFNEHWQLNAHIHNLFNEHYITNSYHRLWSMPGAGRTASVSIEYAF